MEVAEAQGLFGKEVVGNDGSKLGTVEEIYLDESNDRCEWAEVKTGLFGHKRSLIPLSSSEFDGSVLQVPFDKDKVKGAPHHDPGVDLSPRDEAAFFDYYAIPYEGRAGAARAGAVTRGTEANGGGTDEAMTRSEEEIRVGTTSEETGRVRLRKYIVTENVETTVPVSREEVRVEREPITDENRDAAMSGAELSEQEHEVVLHEEKPVVEKKVVPKERVRLDKEETTAEAPVETQVRKERIETEGDADGI